MSAQPSRAETTSGTGVLLRFLLRLEHGSKHHLRRLTATSLAPHSPCLRMARVSSWKH